MTKNDQPRSAKGFAGGENSTYYPPHEQQLLTQQPVRLTETVLRVETAAVAFAAILAAQRDAADSLPRCE